MKEYKLMVFFSLFMIFVGVLFIIDGEYSKESINPTGPGNNGNHIRVGGGLLSICGIYYLFKFKKIKDKYKNKSDE